MKIKKLVQLSLISFVASQQLAYSVENDEKKNLTLPSVLVKENESKSSFKDLPFNIIEIDGKEIDEKGYKSLEELLRSTPGINVNTSGGANVSSAYVRGIGAMYPLSMDDAFVLVNIDGAPISQRHLSLSSLDVQSIEVLKGPQGTTFGGLGGVGAVNIITNKPTSYTQGYFKSEISSDGEHKVDAAVGGALSENVSGRLAIHHSKYEYPIKNLETGKAVSEPSVLGIRGSLNWNINSNTSALLSLEHQKSKHMGENIVLKPYDNDPKMDVTAGIYNYSHKTLDKGTLQIDHMFKNAKLTSISSYSDVYNISPVIYDKLLYNAMYGYESEYWNDQESSDKVFTQDIRLSSINNSNFSWISGVSLLNSNRTYNHSRAGGPNFVVYPGTSQYRDFDTQRYAIYGEVTIPFYEKWKLIAGLRHTWDYKDYSATYTSSGVSVYDKDQLNDNFTTGRIGLSYEISPETNIYGIVSKGYNPGGFQDYARKIGDAKYDAATIYTYELGTKSSFFDEKLTINNSIFYTDVKDNYLIDSTGFDYFVVNADTKSYGYELSSNWNINDNLSLAGNITFTNATIEDNASSDIGGSIKKGNDVPDIANFSSSLSIMYNTPLPNFKIFDASTRLNTRLDYMYVGKRAADVQNNFDLDAYHNINLHLGIEQGKKEFYLWGRNLLNEYYDLYGFYDKGTSVKYGSPAKGRAIGIGFSYTF